MAPVAKHSDAGIPLRRAHRAAWAVFLGMAGTTMAFQVYHAVTKGQMPWELAVLYGVVPLAISVGVLDFASKWRSRLAQAGAYAVTAGAMFLSASATGAVTAHAAPSHAQLLFGGLMDAAALLAIRFIMSGPTAAQAVAKVAAREAELLAAVDAERSAGSRLEAAHQAALSDLRTRAGAEIDARDRALEDAALALASAQSEAETATANAEASARKLAAVTGRAKAGSATRKVAGNSARKQEPVTAEVPPVNPDDLPGNWDALDTEARVLALVDKGYSASKAGLAAGVTDARGRQIARLARDLSVTAPQDVVGGEQGA